MEKEQFRREGTGGDVQGPSQGDVENEALLRVHCGGALRETIAQLAKAQGRVLS